MYFERASWRYYVLREQFSATLYFLWVCNDIKKFDFVKLDIDTFSSGAYDVAKLDACQGTIQREGDDFVILQALHIES